MFYLMGIDQCVANAIRLTGSDKSTSVTDLRARLIDFCVSVGGEAIRPTGTQLITDQKRIAALLDQYRDKSSLTDIESDIIETPLSSMELAMERFKKVKGYWASVDPEFVAVFDFFIHTVFYCRAGESGGGAVSSALGVIWCSVTRKWTDEDLVEFMVHELAHNLLFLDERARSHYVSVSSIADESNWAMSAVLCRSRPLDKCFHSLIVACEILLHREKHGEPKNPLLHPSSESLHEAAVRCYESIQEKAKASDVILPRGFELLSAAGRMLQTHAPETKLVKYA